MDLVDWSGLRNKMRGEEGFHPCSSEPEVGLLCFALIKMIQPQRVLELGTWRGFTTLFLIEAMDGKGKESVVTIDMDDNRSPILKNETADRYTFIKSLSIDAISRLTDVLDFVFIDTDHRYEYCMQEVNSLMPLLHAGSLLVFHDPMSFPGIQQVINELKQGGGFEGFTLPTPVHAERNFPTVCGLGILRKI